MSTQQQAKVEVEINFLSVDQRTGTPIVVLKEKVADSEDEKRILPIVIGEPEATAIKMHLEKIKRRRPMTHDLLRIIIEALDAKLIDVCVTTVEKHSFYANMTLQVYGNPLDVDCRPSDAIALALRCNATIYVAEDVIANHGFLEQDIAKDQKNDPKDVLENLDDDTLKHYTV